MQDPEEIHAAISLKKAFKLLKEPLQQERRMGVKILQAVVSYLDMLWTYSPVVACGILFLSSKNMHANANMIARKQNSKFFIF